MTLGHFNRSRFYVVTTIVFLIILFSLLNAWAREEGTLGDSVFFNSVADMFLILRYPAFLLIDYLSSYKSGADLASVLFFPSLLINAILYGFFLELAIARLASMLS